jgi:hypothetical protein
MRFVDRSCGVTVASFLFGAVVGALAVLLLPTFYEVMSRIVDVRVLAPVQATSALGRPAILALVFVNNSVPAVLSFVYPLVVANVPWTPPITYKRRKLIIGAFSPLTGSLIGFFGLGAFLALGWLRGGTVLVVGLLSSSWLHGPLEFASILLCVSEPLRLAADVDFQRVIRNDLRLLLACLLGLLLSATIEVYMGL